MKRALVGILGMTWLLGVCSAEGSLDFKDRKVRLSYSAGYQVGGDFLRQGKDIRPEVLLRGVQDALTGKEPLMSPQEMRATLMDLQRTVAAAQRQKKKEQADRNLEAGMKFLAENAKKEGVVSLPSGLQYKIISEGSGRTPGETDTVTVHYRGTLIDGTEFDSSYRRGKPTVLEADRVIAGWKEALQMMKEGAVWQLFIPPHLAYGEHGVGRVEPNSTLIFDVELISIEPSN